MKPGIKEVMFIEKQAQAILDLDEIADYLPELGGFSLAERFLEQTEAAFAQLSEYPESGSRCLQPAQLLPAYAVGQSKVSRTI